MTKTALSKRSEIELKIEILKCRIEAQQIIARMKRRMDADIGRIKKWEACLD